MKKKNLYHIDYYYLIPLIIAICLIAVGFSVLIIYTDSQKNSNIIQNAISLSTLLVTGITLVFLYLTLKQQQKQIDNNKSDVDINRNLDLIYKQLEYSSKILIKDDKVFLDSFHSIKSWSKKNYIINMKAIGSIVKNIYSEFMFYKNIIENGFLEFEDRRFLMQIIIKNLPIPYLEFIEEYNSIDFFAKISGNHNEEKEFRDAYREVQIKTERDPYEILYTNPFFPSVEDYKYKEYLDNNAKMEEVYNLIVTYK
ncbi:hypothetical protein [Sphingobacterium mizutaii]|uniref:hypothetical protein n=1 Tax=Sphingobacterium mizutaii TaxID=1010 RepID=UPI00162725D1|nr:hypothetical protein [Sphingobacterium mizutaii]